MPDEIKIWSRVDLWYPQGAGGMWLNYLMWCSRNNRTIPGKHTYYELPYLQGIDPEYRALVFFTRHAIEYDEAVIRLGGNYWFNFYLNVCTKKDDAWDCQARSLFEIRDMNMPVNLDWKTMINNPEQFLVNLEHESGYRVYRTPLALGLFPEYRSTCPNPDLDDPEFQESELYQTWMHELKNYYQLNNEEALAFTRDCYCRL